MKHLPYDAIGVGDQCIMYASDYPHPDSKWPNTIAPIQKAEMIAVVKKRILGKNPARLYGLGESWCRETVPRVGKFAQI